MATYSDERAQAIIAQASEWYQAWWDGTLSPHEDHGPIIAVVALAESLLAERMRIQRAIESWRSNLKENDDRSAPAGE